MNRYYYLCVLKETRSEKMIPTTLHVHKNEIVSDSLGRSFKKLRVSLTKQCNYNCTYCVVPPSTNPIPGAVPVETKRILDFEELVICISSIHKVNPIDEIKLTGGEPLLYYKLIPLIKEIGSMGIENISLTTNGQLLGIKANELFKAGIRKVNVSLDAIDPDIFNRITRTRSYYQVIKGIDKALQVGLGIKLNAVIMKGVNEGQIVQLLDFAKARGLVVRFLEVMKMGYLYNSGANLFFSEKEMLEQIRLVYDIEPLERAKNSTANYWLTDNGTKFGIIANESAPFCSDCDRLRLDSSGDIYGCICSDVGISVLQSSNGFDLKGKLKQALAQKQKVKFKGSSKSMKQIGG